MQYLIVSGVTDVFTQPTHAVRTFLSQHLKVICHRHGPYCASTTSQSGDPATPADARGPIAAVHVRHGDSCDGGRTTTSAGPFNAMFAYSEKTKKLERLPRRLCYSWSVYRRQLATLQGMYGVRTAVVVTDDHTGSIFQRLQHDTSFNWVYLDFPRAQFKKGPWMEFRSDLDENAPFSLAAELELMSSAHMFVGNMGCACAAGLRPSPPPPNSLCLACCLLPLLSTAHPVSLASLNTRFRSQPTPLA